MLWRTWPLGKLPVSPLVTLPTVPCLGTLVWISRHIKHSPLLVRCICRCIPTRHAALFLVFWTIGTVTANLAGIPSLLSPELIALPQASPALLLDVWQVDPNLIPWRTLNPSVNASTVDGAGLTMLPSPLLRNLIKLPRDTVRLLHPA